MQDDQIKPTPAVVNGYEFRRLRERLDAAESNCWRFDHPNYVWLYQWLARQYMTAIAADVRDFPFEVRKSHDALTKQYVQARRQLAKFRAEFESIACIDWVPLGDKLDAQHLMLLAAEYDDLVSRAYVASKSQQSREQYARHNDGPNVVRHFPRRAPRIRSE